VRSDSDRPTDGVSIRWLDRWWPARAALLAATTAITVLLAGCSQPADPWTRAAVSGRVTLDGVPLSEGTITFFPSGTTKGPAAGGPIVEGRYAIPAAEGPVVGTNRVEIRSVQKTGRLVKPPVAVETDGPPIDRVEELKEVVPPRYNRDSTLEFTIVADCDNVFDIPLESAAPLEPHALQGSR
jgi:hypothetical protein